jgi:hypothetical protein
VSAKAAYRRVRKVIVLQWRGIMVVVILITTATYFAVVFLQLDNASVSTQRDPTLVLPWATCLFLNGGDKNKCLDQVSAIILGEPSVATCLYLIAFLGVWCVLFLGRWSMVGAWWDLICSPFRSDSDNWVSADARRLSDPRNYEMLTGPPQQYYLAKGPSGLVATTSVANTEKPQALGEISPSPEFQRTAVRDFSPSPRDPGHVEDTGSIVERTLSNSSLQVHPTRSASQNTARVTFSRDTPTPIQAAALSPRSPSSNEYHTPRTYASPAASTNQDYFSTSRTNARAELERSGSTVSRSHATSAARRDRHGYEGTGTHPSTRDADHRPTGGGGLREWDPQSTFAQGNSSRQQSRSGRNEF